MTGRRVQTRQSLNMATKYADCLFDADLRFVSHVVSDGKQRAPSIIDGFCVKKFM
jgi:hypothetical protein